MLRRVDKGLKALREGRIEWPDSKPARRALKRLWRARFRVRGALWSAATLRAAGLERDEEQTIDLFETLKWLEDRARRAEVMLDHDLADELVMGIYREAAAAIGADDSDDECRRFLVNYQRARADMPR